MTTETKFIMFGIPDDERLLRAVGEVTIRHGHLDYILRMTIKTIANLSIDDPLDATSGQGSAVLRKRIRKLAKQRFGEGAVLLLLEAILTRAQRLTHRRNRLIHSLWGRDLDGIPVVRQDDHSWETVPSFEEVNSLSSEIEKVAKELNGARLDGFIFEALKPEATT